MIECIILFLGGATYGLRQDNTRRHTRLHTHLLERTLTSHFKNSDSDSTLFNTTRNRRTYQHKQLLNVTQINKYQFITRISFIAFQPRP